MHWNRNHSRRVPYTCAPELLNMLDWPVTRTEVTEELLRRAPPVPTGHGDAASHAVAVHETDSGTVSQKPECSSCQSNQADLDARTSLRQVTTEVTAIGDDHVGDRAGGRDGACMRRQAK